MGSALSSSIVEEELNGNSVSNTAAEEKLLVMTKKNKELEQKVAWAEEKFNEMVEKNEEICKVNQDLDEKVRSLEKIVGELTVQQSEIKRKSSDDVAVIKNLFRDFISASETNSRVQSNHLLEMKTEARKQSKDIRDIKDTLKSLTVHHHKGSPNVGIKVMTTDRNWVG